MRLIKVISMKQHTTLHWQYVGAANIYSIFVRYTASVSSDE